MVEVKVHVWQKIYIEEIFKQLRAFEAEIQSGRRLTERQLADIHALLKSIPLECDWPVYPEELRKKLGIFKNEAQRIIKLAAGIN